jgi:amino acid transporter
MTMMPDTLIIVSMLVFYATIFAGLITLQFMLSKLNRDWPSLILPIFSFAFSFLSAWLLLLDLYSDSTILDVMPTWIVMNIPTVVYMIIRRKVRHKKNQDRS